MKLSTKINMWGKGEREALNKVEGIFITNMYIIMLVLCSIVFKWGVLIQYIGIGVFYFYNITGYISVNKWLKQNLNTI